ncbi:hypothetical protein [Bacillus solimangrovi]|uniref:Uncharacterized protein n=1 Tax=Bacillus solimangrovi TaxID=1305675 RepID=A0A1E5LDA9_9BACI|nr:hypothetical protein [Bacillus solimangrovi]OEH92063.1 hypothetical protein BFG57_16960 [Bacillus solimangrovi]
MKKYYIELPYVAVLKVEVNAETEEEALEKLVEADKEEIFRGKIDDILYIGEDWNYHEQVTQRNVSNSNQYDMFVEEIEREDEDK